MSLAIHPFVLIAVVGVGAALIALGFAGKARSRLVGSALLVGELQGESIRAIDTRPSSATDKLAA